MTRPIRAVIDSSALLRNIECLREKAGARFFWAVVKADAYGHGLIGLLPVFDKAVDGLALLDPSEGVQARKAGWRKPILLIEGVFSEADIQTASEYDFETLIHQERQIEWLECAQLKKPLRVHVKCNTGMNRLGFRPDRIQGVLERLQAIPNVVVADILAHFANAELTYPQDRPVTVEKQLAALQALRAYGNMCLSNTGAILWHPEALDHAVRAGIAMYGVSPDGNITSEALGVEPVMNFESEIMALQDLEVGEAVGYGSKFIAQRPTRLAIVACGYADGYPRKSGKDRKVFVEGRFAPVVGNVSMDMLTIDVTDVPQAGLGSRVVFWGRELSVNEAAASFDTIGYELLCAVAKRVPRVLK